MELTEDEKVLRALLQFVLCEDARRSSSEAPLKLKYRDLILAAFEPAVRHASTVALKGGLPKEPEWEPAPVFVGAEMCQQVSLALQPLAIEGPGSDSQATDGPKGCHDIPNAEDPLRDKTSLKGKRGRWKNKTYNRSPATEKEELKNKQTQVLGQFTKTLQDILSKLQNPELPPEHRERYQAMAQKIHEKIKSIKPSTQKKKKKSSKGQAARSVEGQEALNASHGAKRKRWKRRPPAWCMFERQRRQSKRERALRRRNEKDYIGTQETFTDMPCQAGESVITS
eukprot:Skav236109  [mRNA]  locus=scaffold1166:395337:396185:+ [translate_table: standard]